MVSGSVMIYKLWCKILGQTCNWVEKEKIHVWGNPEGERPTNIVYLLECKTCGEIKKFKLN